MSVTAQHRKLDIVSDKAVIAIELIRIATKNFAYFHMFVYVTVRLRNCLNIGHVHEAFLTLASTQS